MNARFDVACVKVSAERLAFNRRHTNVVQKWCDVDKIGARNANLRNFSEVLIVEAASLTAALDDPSQFGELDEAKGSMQIGHVIAESERSDVVSPCTRIPVE